MGAWAAGNFSNDAALDFVDDLGDFREVERTVTELAAVDEELEVDAASVALAACDMLAANLGRPPADLPNGRRYKGEAVSDGVLEIAKALVARVRQSSELAELWAEGDPSDWHAVLDDLVLRLTPSAAYDSPTPPETPTLPDDFIGYCYICFKMVTKRNGILFEHTEEGAGTCSIHPHRKCIEDQIAGPHWNADGSPTAQTRRKLLNDMGIEPGT